MDIWICILDTLLAAQPLQSHLPTKLAINVAIWTAIAWSSRSQLRVSAASLTLTLLFSDLMHLCCIVLGSRDFESMSTYTTPSAPPES
jgi:hypothetical protein